MADDDEFVPDPSRTLTVDPEPRTLDIAAETRRLEAR